MVVIEAYWEVTKNQWLPWGTPSKTDKVHPYIIVKYNNNHPKIYIFEALSTLNYKLPPKSRRLDHPTLKLFELLTKI